jgi:hypothetical protein
MEHLVDEAEIGDGRVGATFGLLSALLLASAFLWAHHWGPLAYAVVAAWAACTMLAFLFGVRTLRMHAAGRALAWVGILFALTSIVVLAGTGVAFAAGYDPAGLCGGG